MIVSQYEDTAERFRNLGYPSERLHVTGNVKFDLTVSAEMRGRIALRKDKWRGERLCWIAASTHPGEDEVVLDAFIEARNEFPDMFLVLAPRHPHRARENPSTSRSKVAYLCEALRPTPKPLTF